MAPHDDSPVIAIRTRVEHERGRWVVFVDAICIPDHDEYVITHRIADYPTKTLAELAARWIERIGNKDLSRP